MRSSILKTLTALLLLVGWVMTTPAQLNNTAQIGGNKIGTVTDNGGGSYDIVGGGNDIWDQIDEFTYAYQEVVGDFDVQVRVQSLAFNATWTKAGIMARESLSEFSRCLFPRVTPDGGANDNRFSYRTGLDNNAGASGGQHEDCTDCGNQRPGNGHRWVRLQRLGSVFNAFSSTDGSAWVALGTQDTATWGGGALPQKLFVGLGVGRHSGGPTALAEFRDYQLTQGPFAVVDASTRGHPSRIYVRFNKAVGAGALTPGNYSLSGNSGTVLRGMRFTSANDAPDRDPMTFVLEGTTGTAAAGPWTQIASGNTGLSTTRLNTAPDVLFFNQTAYSAYRIIFPTVRNAAGANSMQIAEVAFLNGAGNDVTAPGNPVIPSSANHPAGEAAPFAIDNNVNTKYLNFDELNTGFAVTPASVGAATVISATAAPGEPDVVCLTVSPLLEGTSYTVTVSGVQSAGGDPLNNATASAVHGAGFEARRIRVTHNKTDNGGYYRFSDAVALGIGDPAKMVNATVLPAIESNTVFEDPTVDNGDNERFSARISGVLNITTGGNHIFAMSSDDVGYTYLSSDDQPAHKAQIASEPAWNGRREYIAGGNQGSRGAPPSNISSPINLAAGGRYYLETIFTEGGGGNNGSATWQPPGGPAIANGSSPITEANFVPSRLHAGRTFFTLGEAFITQSPANTTVPAGQQFTLRARCDGTPSWALQWYRNNSPIPGANGFSYTATAAYPADDGAQYYFVVTGPFNSATSAVATLTVLIDQTPPTLVSAHSGIGNTNVFLRFSEVMLAATTGDQFAYTVPGANVLSATIFDGGSNVVLHLDTPLAPGLRSVTVNGVTDLGLGVPTPNVIDPNPSTASFTAGPLLVCRPGEIQREIYLGLSGPNVLATLFNNPKWPSLPDTLDYLNNTIGQSEIGDNYGMRYAGHIIPPVSGNYFFEMHQDDSGRLRGSPDENANNAATLINIDGSCCGFYPVGPIPLLAGKAYYFDAVMQEGGGGDRLQIRWRPPGVAGFIEIPSSSLAYCYDMSITTPPATQSVDQNAAASFTVGTATLGAAQAVGKLRYQWERSDDNGMTWNPIASATGPSYSLLPALYPADDQAQFRVTVTVAGTTSSQTSAPATLTVVPDVTPPTVTAVLCSPTLTFFTIKYSELMDTNTSADQFSYAIGGNPPAAVEFDADLKTVRLLFAHLASTTYNIEIANVTDLAGNVITPVTIPVSSCVEACGGLKFETYDTGGGTAVSVLTSHPNFPNNPDRVTTLPQFDTGPDFRDNYGARIRGLFVPPASGNWIFYVHSDDASQLFLNPTGPTAAGKVMIAQETGCCNAWPTIASTPQALEVGKAYYIEGLYKEGGGGDYMRVAARLQGSADPLVAIPLSQLGQYAPAGVLGPVAFATQPVSQTITQNSTVTFSVAASLPPAADFASITYQWQRDEGSGFMDIPGATSGSYSYGPVPLSHDGHRFRALVCSIGVRTPSDVAVLSVVPDVIPPQCVSATSSDLWTIDLRFSEFVDSFSATDEFNYSVAGATILTRTLLPDGMTVRLTLAAALPDGASVAVTIQDVFDLAGNVIDPNPCTLACNTPVVSCGFVKTQFYFNVPGGDINTINDLLAFPGYPNNPNVTMYTNVFLVPQSNPDRNNFGIRMSGYFTPRATGPHTFYVINDDGVQVRLSPDSNPANAAAIITAPCCTGGFTESAPFVSSPQNLVAGQRYFIEGIVKEVGGGDYIGVAVREPGNATPAGALPPIPASLLSVLVDSTGASLNLTCQPASQKVCFSPSGGAPLPFIAEDFNSGDGGFTVINTGARPASEGWNYDAGSGTWRAPGGNAVFVSSLTSPPLIVGAAGQVRLHLSHRHSFEFNNASSSWDGGQVQVSVNGGPYTTVPAGAFTANGYQGGVVGTGPMQGQLAFINDSPGYGAGTHMTSSADLGTHTPGTTLRVRLLTAYDECCLQQNPSWEINGLTMTQGEGQTPASFTVCANASTPGNANQTIRYQWQRNCGGGWTDIAGANSPTYSFPALLSDNGCRFRAILCIPGATATTEEPLLTVVQANTAPQFEKGPDQVVAEDAGAQSVPGFAFNIEPDSQPAVEGSFSADFAGAAVSVPYTGSAFAGPVPGESLFGSAYIAGGILHLTDAANSLFGVYYTPADPNPVDSYSVAFKLYVGGGTCCGATTADGGSVNIASDLPASPVYIAYEEGDGTGLSVLFDTWDSGGGEAPALNLKWQGVIIASAAIDVAQDGAPASFKDFSVSVTSAGLATVMYDGATVFNAVALSGWAPQSNLRVGFGARTGGANDNHHIDDLVITGINGVGSVPPAPPAGSSVYGSAYLGGGVLHLTDAVNGQSGAFRVDDLLGGAPLGSFQMTFDALVGLGTAPPADGFSVSVAANLPAGPWGLAEEGEGNGLSICFDNFDNGGGEAPSIDVKWQGATIATTGQLPSLETGGIFVPVSIRLDPDGTLDVVANGIPVFTDLPTGYSPIVGARFGLGARTGGLNANHHIDNLVINAVAPNAGDVEAGQIVTFEVSNDNPALFSAQPAIAPNGTLTYTPTANACGQAVVTVVAVDDGGTDPDCGGSDRSAPMTFLITVTPVNDCPTAAGGNVAVNEDSSVAIALVYGDADANGCGTNIQSFTIITPPVNGTLSGVPPNLIYTPTPGYPNGCGHNNGADSFTYEVSDGHCSAAATVGITVIEVNDCPHANARIASDCGVPNLVPGSIVIVSPNNSNACVILDGSLSVDVECDPMSYTWYAGATLLGVGTQINYCFPLGSHVITLVVSDGQCDGVSTVSLEVITGCEAIEALIADIDGSSLDRKDKRPLLASLKAACSSFDRGAFGPGKNQMSAFIHKVQAQIMRDHPVEGQRFIDAAQAIINGVQCSERVHGNNGGGNGTDPAPPGNPPPND